MTDTLRTELLSVPGVASADVDDTDGTPAGVKVQLAPGADARRVGVEVQRILAAHGMRSRFASPDTNGEAPAPPRPQAPAVPAPVPPAAPRTSPASPPPVPEPPPPVAPPPTPPPVPEATIEAVPASAPEPEPTQPAAQVPASTPLETAPVGSGPPIDAAATAGRPAPARLQSVALEERADGLTAVVSLANGRQGARSIGFDTTDLDSAVVTAFLEAAGREVDVLAMEWTQIPEASVVTIVVRHESGSLTAGAAVMRSGRAFAVAAAIRAALDV